MQTIGLVGLLGATMTAVTAVSVVLYTALPKVVLERLERHGRFQGLTETETLVRGTRAGEPPARPLVLDHQSA